MLTSKDQDLEVSFLMPCLNEAETLEPCIRKAQQSITAHGLAAEIVIADNGSTDGSQAVAERLGARVVAVKLKGYGNALRGGIEAARGKYIIMGDADDSYDFSSVLPFVEKLREGHELVMGNRFLGGIRPGAMPWKHRWVGNPILTGIGRLFFHSPAGDFHCGLRAFSKDAYRRMELHTTGMEFASEMVIKASLKGMKIAEVPTILYKDGRSRPPHLRSWRDGWRHLRFMLLFSPRWLFLYPGALLFLLGSFVSLWLLGGTRYIGSVGLDIHTLLTAGFVTLLGYQLITFAVFTKIFAIREGYHPPETHLNKLYNYVTLEVGVLTGLGLLLAGLGTLGWAYWDWQCAGFGPLDPRVSMRQVIPAVVLLTLGVQTVFASFFLSLLGMGRKVMGAFVSIIETPQTEALLSSRLQRYILFDRLNTLYLRWQVEQFQSYLGQRILEIGCGVGGIIDLLGPRELVHGLDVEPDVLEYAAQRFRDRPECRFSLLDVTAAPPERIAELKAERFDSIVCINVLEHIEDHVAALKRMEELLVPGGVLALLVPAHQALYGAYDKLDGHYRRYSKRLMRDLLAQTQLQIVRLHYFNLVGAAGWWTQYKLLRRTIHGEGQFGVMNRLIPLMRRLEGLVKPPFGLSLVAVCRRPGQ